MWKNILSFIGLADSSDSEVKSQSESDAPKTIRAQAAKAASDLIAMVDTGASFSYKLAATESVVLCKDNLLAFYEHIKAINDGLVDNNRLVPVDTFGQNKEYTVRDLMISDGFYLPEDVVRLLAVEISQMCEAIKSSDTSSGGVATHNTRLLAMQLNNSRDICTALLLCYIN